MMEAGSIAGPVAVTALAQNFSMFLHPRSELVSDILRKNGRYSLHDLQILKCFLQPGMAFLDIGANIGWYSLIAARLVGRQGRVYAFEPEPANARLLRKNILHAGLENIEVAELALGDAASERPLFLSPDNFGDHGFAPRAAGGASIAVRIESLDQLLSPATFQRVGLIKIDVQGFEPRVLAGMRNLLKIHRPPMIMEFSPAHIYRCASSPFEIFAFIENYGYLPHQIFDERGPEPQQVLTLINEEDLLRGLQKLKTLGYGIDLLLLPRKPERRAARL